MAFITGQGFMPYALMDIADIMDNKAAPPLKIDHLGLLSFLAGNERKLILNQGETGEQLQQKQIKFKTRWTKYNTTTTDSCTVTNNQQYIEAPVNLSNSRYLAVCLDDRTVQQYEMDAAATYNMGKPPTAIMGEMRKEIMMMAQGVLDGVNSDLWPLLTPNIGVNRSTGNTIDNLNFTFTATNFNVNDGYPALYRQLKDNLFSSSSSYNIVGSGIFENIQGATPLLGLALNGVNTGAGNSKIKFHYDQDAPSLLGNNRILCIDDGAVQLVEFLRFTGVYGGIKPGASIFGTMVLPLQVSVSDIRDVYFDWQLRYSDCPTTFTDSYYGTSIALNRGYNLIISKQFGMFTIPPNAYSLHPGDPMAGNRGTVQYTVTNS
jgi:hypothetical protein